MSLRSGLSIAIVSTVFVSQMILHTAAQAAREREHITFDCDPGQLHGAAKLTCLVKRFEEGRRLFDEETFQGNGRTCVTCHSVENGTFSPKDAQKRLATNPSDPLFVGDGLDDGIHGTSRITEHATVRIEIPLPPRVKLANDPAATSVTLLRGRRRPSIRRRCNRYSCTTAAIPRSKSRRSGPFTRTPGTVSSRRPLQLQLIADFQRTAPRFFSSVPLFLFAQGGPPPRLPNGVTASEKRGRAMFDDVPITPGSTRGLCAMCHSGPMLDVSNEFNIFLPDSGSAVLRRPVSERNKLNLPTYEFIVDGTDRIVTPDPGSLSDRPLRKRVPAGALWSGRTAAARHRLQPVQDAGDLGIKRTAPYFHDNSSKTLEEVAEQYTFMFLLFAGINLTPQDEADIVAFLKLLLVSPRVAGSGWRRATNLVSGLEGPHLRRGARRRAERHLLDLARGGARRPAAADDNGIAASAPRGSSPAPREGEPIASRAEDRLPTALRVAHAAGLPVAPGVNARGRPAYAADGHVIVDVSATSLNPDLLSQLNGLSPEVKKTGPRSLQCTSRSGR